MNQKHGVNMKRYSIFMEGYQVQGDFKKASFEGVVKANSFREACAIKFKGDSNYNEEANTHWGCGFYETLEEAQRSFG